MKPLALSKAFYLLVGGMHRHHGTMNTSEIKTTACLQPAEVLAQQLARLAALWVLRQAGGAEIPLEYAGRVLAAWQKMPPVELALLPDAQRVLAATTRELLEALAQSPEGREALQELGFKTFLEGIGRP